MPLDSYLRDLLGKSSGLEVHIVDDNAYVELSRTSIPANNSKKKVKARSFQGLGWRESRGSNYNNNNPNGNFGIKKPSRWGGGQLGLARNKSDSALGQPPRRSSTEDDDTVSAATCGSMFDLLEIDDAKSTAEFGDISKKDDTNAKKAIANVRTPKQSISEYQALRAKQAQLEIQKARGVLLYIQPRTEKKETSDRDTKPLQTDQDRNHALSMGVSRSRSSLEPSTKSTDEPEGPHQRTLDITRQAQTTKEPKVTDLSITMDPSCTTKPNPAATSVGRANRSEIPLYLRELPYPTTGPKGHQVQQTWMNKESSQQDNGI